jgi:exosortase/archaeosortase family protein
MNNLLQSFTLNIKQHPKKSVFIITIALVAIILWFGGWNWLSHTTIYKLAVSLYAQLVGNSCVLLLQIVGYNASFSSSFELYVTGNQPLQLLPRLGWEYLIIVFFTYLFFFKKSSKNFVLVLTSILILFILTVAKLSAFVSLSNFLDKSLFHTITTMLQYLIVFGFVVIQLKDNQFFRNMNEKLTNILSDRFHFSLMIFLLILVLSQPFMRLLDFYIIPKSHIFFQELTNTILVLSKNILEILGYQVQVSGKYLFLDKYWVLLGPPCLGIGVMSVFTLLILIIRSNWLNKLIYIVFGLVIMILLNAFRIAMLLIYLYNNKGAYTLNMEVHDLSNYFFYGIVFLLFIGFLFWFQNVDLPLFKKKLPKN